MAVLVAAGSVILHRRVKMHPSIIINNKEDIDEGFSNKNFADMHGALEADASCFIRLLASVKNKGS